MKLYVLPMHVKINEFILQKMLDETQKTISEIALDIGFNDMVHFTKVFKSEANMTPSLCRKSLIIE